MRELVTVGFIFIGLALSIIILMQEGKSAGLSGSISGTTETYWGKNKGRSMEGRLEKLTGVLAFLFFVVAAVLSFYH
ncbi:MAG: preprotein translocase subunit SecG [Firmicutes bacterium]|uniref:Protein-export membrane protein SecG n=1 Tax=Candidatus Scybalomonas excrementavium TaxID=2840943 RepID=A0A9D9N6P5_9FIRM|nr:preprotein translocase subunit SecG [Candidatus Scybalomonas excrementavium]